MNGPVIPDFGEASDCVTENRTFCTGWVRENWEPVLQPALVEHIQLTLIAVGIGFAISLAAALAAHRLRFVEAPFALASPKSGMTGSAISGAAPSAGRA